MLEIDLLAAKYLPFPPARLREKKTRVELETELKFYIAFCHIFHLMLEQYLESLDQTGELRKG